MDVQALKDFIRSSPWVFAKTMPECPHEYTTRRNAKDVEAFNAFSLAILTTGKPEPYNGWYRPYLYVDGHKYWVMSNNPNTTSLINRQALA